MKHIHLLLLLIHILFFSCNTEEQPDKEALFFGKVKSVEVQSFQLSYEQDKETRSEITDSLPAWLPIAEHVKEWDDQGLLQKHIIGQRYSTGAPDTLLFIYDEMGRLKEKRRRSVEPSANRWYTYKYNSDGQYNAINVLRSNEQLDSVFLYNYDSEGVLRSVSEFHNEEDYLDFVPTLVRKFFYPVKNMIREDFYPRNPYTGKHYYAKKITKKFKNNGRLFEKVVESGGKTTYQYEYDRAGRLQTIQTLDEYKQLIEQTTFEYDSFGNIVLKSFQSDVGSYAYRCTYTYDDQQNWTTKKIRLADDANPAFLVKRTFNYWE